MLLKMVVQNKDTYAQILQPGDIRRLHRRDRICKDHIRLQCHHGLVVKRGLVADLYDIAGNLPVCHKSLSGNARHNLRCSGFRQKRHV